MSLNYLRVRVLVEHYILIWVQREFVVLNLSVMLRELERFLLWLDLVNIKRFSNFNLLSGVRLIPKLLNISEYGRLFG